MKPKQNNNNNKKKNPTQNELIISTLTLLSTAPRVV